MAEIERAEILIGQTKFTITGADAKERAPYIQEIVDETLGKVRSLDSTRALSSTAILNLALINLAGEMLRVRTEKEAGDKSIEKLKKQKRRLQHQIDDLQVDLMNLEQDNMDLMEKVRGHNDAES